ncbi:TetR/AcrR family transcriptional regulator [Solimonas sp. K1W22B-7]|uniref:TetR/AcrR family transcriptional regulator n=1 Tax=Solimonas sp. K1W22B-7 TaxID=2303331 RepID=UPI000E334782|nr:TetR/AcrR family transcriptional regulator [Solimonas sp. K1W22B-7]AXQ30055.1 TetR/AcrR family transcriptional regulator [Solimonas sp. K1W22B-7]
MGRQEQTEEVRRKVVAAAQRLFLDKGYAQTTLREISTAAGVSYGSIYHHFEDKDGIFRELILDNFETAQEAADRQLTAKADVYLRLGLKWASLAQAISSDARVAELLGVAYRSWKISESLIEVSTARHRDWLRAELPDWTENQFLAATLALSGTLSSMVDEKLNLDRLTPAERIGAVLSSALPGFGADPRTTQRVIKQALELAPPTAATALSKAKRAAGR